MRRRAFLALAGAAASCGGRQSPSERIGVKIAIHPSLATGPFYAALEQGAFTDAGFDVETVQALNSSTLTALLAGGEIDVAFMALNPALISAAAQGAETRVVAGRDVVTPGCSLLNGLYGRREAFPDGLDDPDALRGKRVAILRKANVVEFYLDLLLEPWGLTSDDVEISALRYQEAQAAFIAGHVDAIVSGMIENDLAFDRSDTVRGPNLGDVRPGLQTNYMMYGPRLLGEDVAVGARLLAAYLDGAAAYRAGYDPQALVDWLRETNVRPEALRDSACREAFAQDGAVDAASVQLFIDWCRRKNYIEQAADAADLIDNRFVEAARKLRKTS